MIHTYRTGWWPETHSLTHTHTHTYTHTHIVTYDMGWQKISSGRRYSSSSGHELFIIGISKGIIGMIFYSKSFQKYYAVDNRGEESEEL